MMATRDRRGRRSRIEGIKLVKVATKRRSVTNERYCNQPWAEPSGSMYRVHGSNSAENYFSSVLYIVHKYVKSHTVFCKFR
jgi:hypothetical protein